MKRIVLFSKVVFIIVDLPTAKNEREEEKRIETSLLHGKHFQTRYQYNVSEVPSL